MNLNIIANQINSLNLPIRKTKSKIIYSVYLLEHLIDNKSYFYFGYSNNPIRRFKEHNKTKTILNTHILFQCNSKANAKIVECYLTLYYKLLSNYLISNGRTESCQF